MQTWSEIEPTVYGNPELSKEARMIARPQTRMYEAVEVASEFQIGKKSGDKVAFRLVGDIPELADTPLLETQKIPFGEAPEYHRTGTVYRRGYATPFTGTREDLDRLNTESQIVKALRNQAAKTKNKVIYDVAVAGRSFCYTATSASTLGFTTNGTPTGTAAAAFSMFHLRKLLLKCNEYNIPAADGTNYWFFGSPKIEDDLLQDTAANSFTSIAKYDPSRVGGLLNGEIGKVGRVRFVIDNHIIANSIGSGSAFGSGFLFGADAIKEIMVYPMHFRVQLNLGGDFGNQKAIGWQSFDGFVVPWNYTAHGQGSIIHYTTA